jgi:hypothetical protein
MACGVNSSHPFKNFASTHAEIDALYKIREKRNMPRAINIIIIRISKTGKLGESRPCMHCIDMMKCIKKFKINNIFYSNSHGDIIKERFATMAQHTNTHISIGMRRK